MGKKKLTFLAPVFQRLASGVDAVERMDSMLNHLQAMEKEGSQRWK